SSTAEASGTTAATTQAIELVLAMGGKKTQSTPSAGPTNSFTALTQATIAGSPSASVDGAYFIQTSTGTRNTGWTITSSRWAGAIVAIKQGTTGINPSVSDSATGTESVTAAIQTNLSVSDSTAATTESTNIVTVDILSVNDSATGTEAVTLTVAAPVNVNDSVTV